MTKPLIGHVSDTSLWVAHFRVLETERKDALFRDPLAKRLAGERGREIAEGLSRSQHVKWSVVIRTCIIDDYIHEFLTGPEPIDAVVNLGAGLDTRPYRLDLPGSLLWYEVDHPHIIQLKDERLADEKPRCPVTRIKLDLADRAARKAQFAEIAAKSRRILVLTEGLIPYLTEAQVAELAQDLRALGSFRYWVLDYFAPEIYKYLRSDRLQKELANAPFQFFPSDYYAFFGRTGWKLRTARYLPEESAKLGRSVPMPWWMRLLLRITPPEKRKRFSKFSAYVVLEPGA